jgi:hypothetical protein
MNDEEPKPKFPGPWEQIEARDDAVAMCIKDLRDRIAFIADDLSTAREWIEENSKKPAKAKKTPKKAAPKADTAEAEDGDA